MKQRLLQIFAFLFIILAVGCDNDQNEFILEVNVTIDDGVRVPNALIFVNVPGIPEDSSSVNFFLNTDELGFARAELKAEAVIQVSASRPNFRRCTFVKVEPGVNEVFLELKDVNDAENGCL